MTQAIIFVILPLCLAIAAISDLLTMTIPNRIPAILLGAFILVAPFTGFGVTMIGLHLAAGLIVFAVCFTLFAMNIMGGGDAKLLTATAVWFGFNTSLIEFLIYVSFLGGLLTIMILMLRSREDTILAAGIPVPHLLFTAKKIPYGIAICVGGFLAYPSSPLMMTALSQLR
jgi:prepilin peptidase CpaA